MPIHYAAQHGNILFMHYLICLGEDINIQDKENHTALHWAVYNKQGEMCTYLLNRSSCNINAVDINGWTPLHWAIMKGSSPIVHLLLSKNPNITITDHNGLTPKGLARQHKLP